MTSKTFTKSSKNAKKSQKSAVLLKKRKSTPVKSVKSRSSKPAKATKEVHPPEKPGLNLNQERFCVLYTSDREFFGNGVQAYMEAYGIDKTDKSAYASARSSAYDLLTNPKITGRIAELLEEQSLNDQFVDKQLAFLITQNADFSAKMKAIQEYNKLKKRVGLINDLGDGEVKNLTITFGKRDEK